jgi:RNA polymerase sigma-70 factor (ECF subfamily)
VENSLSDGEAVRRLQRGDEAALVALYDRYAARVFRFAVRLLGRAEEAEEVVAETFLQAFRCARDYRAEGTFSGWLFRIARNLCFDRMRLPRRYQMVSLDELLGEGDEPARGDTAQEWTLGAAVQEALQQLPSDYRIVLTLRDLDGLTNGEAAQALGRSAAATKSLHFRARQALRDTLARALGREE